MRTNPGLTPVTQNDLNRFVTSFDGCVIKQTDQMKPTGPLILLAAALGGLFLFVGFIGFCVDVWDYFSPPKEAALIRKFQDHRSEFNRLHTMFDEDKKLGRLLLYPDGPCPTGLTATRYHEYLNILQQVQGRSVGREEADPAVLKVDLWAEGFAGDSQTVELCWLEQAPPNQVKSLDHYTTMATRYNRIWTYRYVEKNWYLRTDR